MMWTSVEGQLAPAARVHEGWAVLFPPVRPHMPVMVVWLSPASVALPSAQGAFSGFSF